jgi:hypothetical protein
MWSRSMSCGAGSAWAVFFAASASSRLTGSAAAAPKCPGRLGYFGRSGGQRLLGTRTANARLTPSA